MPSTALELTQNPARYDGWTIHLADLHGMGEVFDKPTRTVIIDPTKAGPRKAQTHARAHIALGHVYEPGLYFTPEQEDAADEFVERIFTLSSELAAMRDVVPDPQAA